MNIRAKRIIYPLIVIALGAGIGTWLMANPKSSIQPVETSDVDPLAGAPTITTLNAQSGLYAPQLLLYSQLKSAQQVKVTSSIATDVISVSVAEGDYVEKGSRLVVLDTAPLQRQLDQLQSRKLDITARLNLERKQAQANRAALPVEENLVDIAQRSVNRLANLKNQNLTSSSDIENAERTLQNQILSLQNRQLSVSRFESVEQQYNAQLAEIDSQIDQARATLQDASILAPFSGRVSRVQIQNGAKVQVGTELLTLVDQRQQELVAWVAASALDDIATNDTLIGYLEAGKNLKRVSLDHIDPSAEAGSLRLFFTPKDLSSDLTLNRYYRLWLELPEKNAFAVPLSSVYSNEYVYVVEDNLLQRIKVTVVGERQEGGEIWRLVQGNLNGKTVLVTRLQDAAQGLKVRLANSTDQLASR
jgi:multidrug efflux pump subunit AcrA (membrane-fusion protein)